MKNLSIFTLAGLLATTSITAINAAETINCAILPTCAELGYTDKVAQCPGDSLKCPFDYTSGKCLHPAEVGQIGYFPYQPGKGWLQCNGYFYNKNRYPDLYAKIDTTFGGSGDIFRVPDYQGDFVRVYGGDSKGVTSRQKEGLPNITGAFYVSGAEAMSSSASAAFSKTKENNTYTQHGSGGNSQPYSPVYTFDASQSNAIYGASSHVTPVNTAVYAYIYAGKVDTSAPTISGMLSTCSNGNYLYTNGTCSASYDSTKGTLKGIVEYISTSSSNPYIRYINGGYYGTTTGQSAENVCKDRGEFLTSRSYFTGLPTNIPTSQYVVRSVQAGKYYWSYTSTKVKCSTQTSCASSSDTATSGAAGTAYSPYYYCHGYMYFGD